MIDSQVPLKDEPGCRRVGALIQRDKDGQLGGLDKNGKEITL